MKHYFISLLFTLAFAWSFWFFNNYPETYPPGQEISQRCGEEEKRKPYCVGFSHGYNWAVTQIRIDAEMNEIIKNREETK